MQLDYSNYKFVACVDWIAIEVKFQNATNFTTVQTLLRNILGLGKRNLFVKALCAGAGGAATDYRFSIQNPKRWSQVHAVLEQLNAKKPFSALQVNVLPWSFRLAFSLAE